MTPHDWQPIETAPENEVIDLWSSRGFRLADCVWNGSEWEDTNDHGPVTEAGPFTHWRKNWKPE